jgi:hypothetical protein
MRANLITLFLILAIIATLLAALFDLALIAGQALKPWLGWMLP